ncbi:MAG: F0F1 ATP synthase subunit B [Chthoniobacteraceae bacterium]
MISFITLAAAEVSKEGNPIKEIAETFGVSWWYFLSQVISFTIVALLLQKFAYKPILTVLEERRTKIATGLENAAKIQLQLAEAQKTSSDIIQKANVEAQKMIDEARAAAKALGERESQAAIATAEQIITKAREATVIEREKAFAELKREISRLVINTTSKVTGKVLTADDQRRLSEEAYRELAA